MPVSQNEIRAKQLGMPFGTAANRLRKLILFSLLVKHQENFCFKCQKEIKVVDELTIEHKKPWLHVSADLFWDLDNIAFSHTKCNTPDRPSGWRRKFRIAPEGKAWCGIHREFLPVENFSKNRVRKNGLQGVCKKCDHKGRKLPQPS